MKANLGRVLFAVPFGIFGVIHLTHPAAMAAHVPSWLPGGAFWVLVTGVVFLLAAVLIVTLRRPAIGYAAIGGLLLIFIFAVHLPALGREQGAEFRATMMNLLKDVSLLGGVVTGLAAATSRQVHPAAGRDPDQRDVDHNVTVD